MKVSKNFELTEFIHPNIILKCGDRALDFLNPHLIDTVQLLRDKFGQITINNWKANGFYESSGLRIPHGSVGSMLSAHKFGCAADCKFATADPVDVQTYIITNPSEFPHITRLENAVITRTWLHVECGNRRADIKVYNP